jgi:hypothetical protein
MEGILPWRLSRARNRCQLAIFSVSSQTIQDQKESGIFFYTSSFLPSFLSNESNRASSGGEEAETQKEQLFRLTITLCLLEMQQWASLILRPPSFLPSCLEKKL